MAYMFKFEAPTLPSQLPLTPYPTLLFMLFHVPIHTSHPPTFGLPSSTPGVERKLPHPTAVGRSAAFHQGPAFQVAQE